ncbi:MAG: tetratricopeptide repeat-containing protein [Betaproteobacteria bacterium]|nr:tetratricopeptide repeat-containing protein [Betaproteobacteria bacterium]
MNSRHSNWRWLAVLLLSIGIGNANAQSDALILQQQAIKRIDAFVLHFRQTGDFKRMNEFLAPAQQELVASAQAFEARKDVANLVVSLYRLAEVQRLQGHWQNAVKLYQQTLALARKVNDELHQARALGRMALAKRNARDSQGALEDATRAVTHAQRAGDAAVLFDALNIRAQVQVDHGDIAAANETLTRAFDAARASNKP